MNKKLVKRFLYTRPEYIFLDENGLLMDTPDFTKNALIDLSHASKLQGGILLAEGGMGKSTYMELLKNSFKNDSRPVKLLRIGEFARDSSGLREDLDASRAEEARPVLILDGIDEALDLVGPIVRYIRDIRRSLDSDALPIWLASRDCDEIRYICSELNFTIYYLAPLSKENIRELAFFSGLNGDDFLFAVSKCGLTALCAKPFGCDFALSAFKENRLEGASQVGLWQSGIRKLCGQTPSNARRLQPCKDYSLDDIVSCSAWIALSLVLTDRRFIWGDEESNCPPHFLSIGELRSNHFSMDLIRVSLSRGIFSPLGDGRIEFSHESYKNYLASVAFKEIIPSENWDALLFNAARNTIYPQRMEIASWIAGYDVKFVEKLFEIQPELLLCSADSVRSIGADRLCEELLQRASTFPCNLFDTPFILANLHRLRGSIRIVESYLLNPDSDSRAIDFATKIAEACDYSEISSIFAERALDKSLQLDWRVDASYAVCRLNDENAKARLKNLLPLAPEEDPDDDLRGNLLRACWPKHLTDEELLVLLTAPQKTHHVGAYAFFLRYVLPCSLYNSVNEENAIIFLRWAISLLKGSLNTTELPLAETDSIEPLEKENSLKQNFLNKYNAFNGNDKLACIIYTICWQWAQNTEIRQLLLEGYVASIGEDISPFLNETEIKEFGVQCFSKEGFLKDSSARMMILEEILAHQEFKENWISPMIYKSFPLCVADDLPLFFKRLIDNPTDKLADRMITCMQLILWQDWDSLLRKNAEQIYWDSLLRKYAEQIDELHALRPDLIKKAEEIREEYSSTTETVKRCEAERGKENEKIESKFIEKQMNIDEWVKKTLQHPKAELFEQISCWLGTSNGFLEHDFGIDLQKTSGWSKLEENEQWRVVELAERYLREAEIKATEQNSFQSHVSRALTLIRLRRPDVFSRLDHNVWDRCSVELIKGYRHTNKDLMDPLLDTLSERFPKIAGQALLDVLHHEMQCGNIAVIGVWGKRLSEEQARLILDNVKKQNMRPEEYYSIFEELSKSNQKHLVENELDVFFETSWAEPPTEEYHELRRIAFELAPDAYIDQLLRAISNNPTWGQEWFEKVMRRENIELIKAFRKCPLESVAELYIWLHKTYPTAKCPDHIGCYSRSSIDNIYELKNYLTAFLKDGGEEGSERAWKKIAQEFPDQHWIKDCIYEARKAECGARLPILSISVLKTIVEDKNCKRRLIFSAQDLLELVMEKLQDYECFLQGDIPRIGDLWDTKNTISPREEEYLSDHLKSYLDLTLTSNIFVNREVQIRRKLFKEGEKGSETDIWIQVNDENRKQQTLCIEVKCNWNSSSKNAIKNQLIEKYMSGGTAGAGILLLGWFECSTWNPPNNSRAWPDIETANQVLKKQVADEIAKGYKIDAFVLNCTMQ